MPWTSRSRTVRLVAFKPAFGGRLVAAIRADSPIQMATVRPGVLPVREPRPPGSLDHRLIEVEARIGPPSSSAAGGRRGAAGQRRGGRRGGHGTRARRLRGPPAPARRVECGAGGDEEGDRPGLAAASAGRDHRPQHLAGSTSRSVPAASSTTWSKCAALAPFSPSTAIPTASCEFADVGVIGDWREVGAASSTSFGSTAGRAAPGMPSEPDTDVQLGDGP